MNEPAHRPQNMKSGGGRAGFIPSLARLDANARTGRFGRISRIIVDNKTRQGYARKRTLKPAGYFFVAPESVVPLGGGGSPWHL